MNAAYLVLTTAWLAGDAPAAPAPAPAAPVVSAPIGGGCGGGCGAATDACCDSGCGGGKFSLFGKLKGKFQKGCGCESSCAPVQQHCAPAPTCCEAPRAKKWKKHNDCCEQAPTCDDGCGKGSLFGKLKGKFRKHGDCGCDSGCGSSSCGCGGGSYGGAVAPGAPVETIPGAPRPAEGAPRRMPATPAAPGTGSVMNGVPTIVTPVVAPRLSSEQPF